MPPDEDEYSAPPLPEAVVTEEISTAGLTACDAMPDGSTCLTHLITQEKVVLPGEWMRVQGSPGCDDVIVNCSVADSSPVLAKTKLTKAVYEELGKPNSGYYHRVSDGPLEDLEHPA